MAKELQVVWRQLYLMMSHMWYGIHIILVMHTNLLLLCIQVEDVHNLEVVNSDMKEAANITEDESALLSAGGKYHIRNSMHCT